MQNNEMVVMLVELIVTILGFAVGRYLLPKYKDTLQSAVNQFQMLLGYAESFCAYAKQFMTCSGSEKMDSVVEKLSKICSDNGIEMDNETLRAIGQKAYDSMKLGEAQASATNTIVIQQSALDDVKEYVPSTEETTEEENTDSDPDWDTK
jgi:hypothetical protein